MSSSASFRARVGIISEFVRGVAPGFEASTLLLSRPRTLYRSYVGPMRTAMRQLQSGGVQQRRQKLQRPNAAHNAQGYVRAIGAHLAEGPSATNLLSAQLPCPLFFPRRPNRDQQQGQQRAPRSLTTSEPDQGVVFCTLTGE